MITKSTSIVRGTVVRSYAASQGPVIYTHYVIQVTERFKGSAPNSTEVVVPGGTLNNLRQTFAGVPQLNAGDDSVFFLWTSRSGTTQIIGLTQGLFTISGGSANPTATRAASRELMLEHGTGRQVKDQALALSLSDLRSHIAGTLGGGAKAQ
jgi:hypothetical protein